MIAAAVERSRSTTLIITASISLLLAAAGLLLRIVLEVGPSATFITFYIPIALAGLIGGFRQAILTTFLVVVLVAIAAPLDLASFHGSIDVKEFVLFVLNGVFVGWASDYRPLRKDIW